MRLLYAYAAPIEAGPLPGEGHPVEFLQLGVGKTAATHSLALRLADSPPDLVVLFGIGGAHRNHDLNICDLCLVTHDQLADEGVDTEAGFLSLQDLSLSSIGPFEMHQDHTAAIAECLKIKRMVRGATVSTCSGTHQRAADISARGSTDIETMEGAAAAFACQQAGVPMVQLRCISNFTGDRELASWDLDRSTSILHSAVRALIDELET